MTEHEMNTVTQKLEIGGKDLYVHAGWDHDGVLRYLDLRLSMGVDSNVRAALDVVVAHAKELVDSGIWTLEKMYKTWGATHLEPCGLCRQLEGFVTSPLDAAARFLEKMDREFSAARITAEAEERAEEGVADV